MELPAVEGTLKSPLQHHSSKPSDSEKVKEKVCLTLTELWVWMLLCFQTIFRVSKEKGMTEDEMARWHYQVYAHEFG